MVADCAYSRTGEGLHRFVDPVDEAVYLYTQFEAADARRMYRLLRAARPQGDVHLHRRRSRRTGRSCPTRRRPPPWSYGRREGVARWGFDPTPRMSTYITALVAGPYHVVRDHHGAVPLGVFCRRSLAEFLDADAILVRHQAGLRLLPGGLRLPIPVREVRPALRARLQRGSDGERRLRHDPRGLRLPVEDDRRVVRASRGARSCTSWRTCGSATWSPCAGGTTCG